MYLGRICNTVHTNLDTAVSEIEKKIGDIQGLYKLA